MCFLQCFKDMRKVDSSPSQVIRQSSNCGPPFNRFTLIKKLSNSENISLRTSAGFSSRNEKGIALLIKSEISTSSLSENIFRIKEGAVCMKYFFLTYGDYNIVRGHPAP